MTLSKLLKWTGRAFPSATAEDRFVYEAKDLPRGSYPYARMLRTTGQGREKKVIGASGIWRNFADIRQDNETKVVEFVRRWGDPFAELAPDTPSPTSSWNAVAQRFETVASFWSRVDADGISRFQDDPARRVTVMKDIRNSPEFANDIQVVFDVTETGEIDIHLAPRSLAGFMLASAMAHLETGQSMRRCETCDDWFAIGKRDSRFCSPSCRAMHHTRLKVGN